MVICFICKKHSNVWHHFNNIDKDVCFRCKIKWDKFFEERVGRNVKGVIGCFRKIWFGLWREFVNIMKKEMVVFN